MSISLDGITPAVPATAQHRSIRFTVFAWLWASQALVHQEFYSSWLENEDPRGWILTILAVATLLRPSSVRLFCGMLIASIVYNIAKWPFVVNHILLETLINFTLLAAVAQTAFSRRRQNSSTTSFGDEVIDRVAPVICTSMTVMYWFAFLAKLNFDFLNPAVSCVTAMYGDLQRRIPFLPGSTIAHQTAIALTLLVEGLLPLLLSFRRTQPLAILIGLPFHFLLGLVGHRTFSALAFAVYGLFLIDRVSTVAELIQRRIAELISKRSSQVIRLAVSLVVVSGVSLLVAAKLSGHFRDRLIVVGIYQIPWLIWIAWSMLIGATYTFAIWWSLRGKLAMAATRQKLSPGLLWLCVAIVVLNGLSPYLGLKTETSFTMYSNLRIEGEWNNHFFLPAIKIGPWQADLATIVSTDHPALLPYVEHGDLITYFELRRIVHQTSSEMPFQIVYLRGEEQHVWSQSADGVQTHTAGIDPHPQLLGRLLYFRPISTDECMPCRH